MPTLNWTYGAKTPDIEDAVTDAIRAAHRYRNKLCELELAKRERHEALLQRLAPEYVTACQAVEAEEQKLGEAREAIQRERVKQQTRTPKGCETLRERANESKSRLKDLRAERKARKQEAYDDSQVKAAMKENQQRHADDCAAAKKECGLYWGTEAVVRSSCSSFSSGSPPRFKRFEGEGQLAVQLQNGLDCRDAMEPDTRLQLLVPDALQEQLWMDGKARKGQQKAECLVRIGSEGREPIFARVPIVFHRPLPTGKIKWAYLERRMIANKPHWKIRLTIDVDTPDPGPPEKPTVAIHVGWRIENGDMRVCTWEGSDGRRGTLRLPERHLADYARLDKVQSERDTAFNQIKPRAKEWLDGLSGRTDWLDDARKHLHQWRSQGRLAGLIHRCRDEDIETPEWLNEWRKDDKHLWQHERRLSLRIVRRRKDLYRNFAAQLRRDYDVAVVAPIDAKRLAMRSNPEDLEPDVSKRRGRQAAVASLVQMVREKFRMRCVDVDCANVSRECSRCGAVNGKPKRRKVQCTGCLRTFDIDENGAAVTLSRGLAALESGALLELEKAEEERVKSQQERLQKMQEGRRKATSRKRQQNVGA